MNCGAIAGATKAVWFPGRDSLAVEMLQAVCISVGAAKAGTAKSMDTSNRANIIWRVKNNPRDLER